MPYFCRSLISQALNHGAQKSLKGSRILVLGVAYKADIDDMRESPALKLIELLQNAGRRRRLPRPARARAARAGLASVAARAGGVRLRRDRHRALGDRLRAARRRGAARRRLPERDRRARRVDGKVWKL